MRRKNFFQVRYPCNRSNQIPDSKFVNGIFEAFSKMIRLQTRFRICDQKTSGEREMRVDSDPEKE